MSGYAVLSTALFTTCSVGRRDTYIRQLCSIQKKKPGNSEKRIGNQMIDRCILKQKTCYRQFKSINEQPLFH